MCEQANGRMPEFVLLIWGSSPLPIFPSNMKRLGHEEVNFESNFSGGDVSLGAAARRGSLGC